jgi:CheY-like chemotaxis protein
MLSRLMTPTKPAPRLGREARQVMIVNGSHEILELLETVLEPGHYDVVFVESAAHAYSKIKQVRPNLIILCLRMNDPEPFQVLTMLKLDEETGHIPVLTCTTELEGTEPANDEEPEVDPGEIWPTVKPAVSMN